MAAQWTDYLRHLRELAKTIGQLTGVEQEKLDAVGRGDLLAVEECMKREQVLSLALRGADQKRAALLRELGVEGVTLRDLQKHSPQEYDLETKEAAETLRRQYDMFQAVSQAARNALECNLRAIERLQKSQGQPPREGAPHQTDFRA